MSKTQVAAAVVHSINYRQNNAADLSSGVFAIFN